jgi:DNA-binding NarL/FixJ family response regulator
VIRILIADDHAIVRGGLKEILLRQLTDVVVGEAGDAQQALAQFESGVWESPCRAEAVWTFWPI